MLYALPSQGEEVAEIGRQLGLAAVLAIGQILDQTSARMRVSMHGRTLVEMAIVRICQLGELDDLASLVAELRGASNEQSDPRVAGVERQRAPSAPPTGPLRAADPAKKNADRPATASLANGLANAVASAIATAPPRIAAAPPLAGGSVTDNRSQQPDSAAAVNELPAESASPPAVESASVESVLAQFQRAVAEGGTTRTETPPPRKSRREQLAQIADQPFVRRAIELFDVQPGQLRYAPPEGESN